MARNYIAASITADTKELVSAADRAKSEFKDVGKAADNAGRDVAEGVDKAGGNTAKLAGAFGDLAGGLGMIGLGGFGGQLEKVAPLLMFAAGAADVFTVASEALNVSLLANPITIVVLALAAIAVGFTIAWKKSATFRDIVTGVGDAVLAAFKKVATFFTDTLPNAFKAVATFVAKWTLPGIIIGHRDAIIGAFKKVGDFITDTVPGYFKSLVGFLEKWDPVKPITSAVSGIGGAFRDVLNGVIDLWNSVDFGINIKVPNWVPGVGGKGFSVPDIFPDVHRLAKGGIVVAGDNASGIEAVVPLERAGEMGFGGTTNVYVTVNVPVGTSPLETAAAIKRSLSTANIAGVRTVL